jgi:hypothetical protein
MFVMPCFVLLFMRDPLNWDASACVLGVFGKLSMRRGACMGLVPGSIVFGLAVQKFLNIQ